MNLKIIDAHTHVQFEQYDKDREGVIKRALDKEIGMINAGADLKSSQEAVNLAHKYDGIWATVGLHPTDAKKDLDKFDEIGKLAADDKVVGIGECGMDFYREEDRNNRVIQEELFIKHIKLSDQIKKPLVIHCREAFPGTFEILENHKDFLLKNAGIFHFFTGGIEEAKKALNLGFSFTFGGLITYNRQFDEVIKYIPIENILIETDAPFVSPLSHRKERNEPSFVGEVLESISVIKNMSLEETEKIIFKNTTDLFGVI
ncbi:MAG: TatD family hydrolase [Candidatus Paceibacterota bacterium]|jgi:TatD DNase family protein